MPDSSVNARQPRTSFEERYLAEARRICLEMVPEAYEVFLFGSRARGHCDHSSDLDIGIVREPEYQPALDMIADRNTCSRVYREAILSTITARLPQHCVLMQSIVARLV